MDERRPLLLQALNDLYKTTTEDTEKDPRWVVRRPSSVVSHSEHAVISTGSSVDRAERTALPENSHQFSRSSTDSRANRTLCAAHVDNSSGGPEDSVSSLVHRAAGHVSLVGAGPGDPGLLTRRAVARLRAADLVLYDALIDRRVLKLARHAQRFFVGKRAGRHAMSQPAINALMIRAARRGKRVVRLKGGDPFVFGRGGEEALALHAAGIRFEIVPGITSAVAAPALAGIPVTHRGVSSAFLVVGGHDADAFGSAIDAVVPDEVTLVVLMGVGRRVAIANRLIERGWNPRIPAAIVVDASKATQAVWRGTLQELAEDEIDIDVDGPGTIVIGRVVAVATMSAREAQDPGNVKRQAF
jgi:uroporphyrin-III C-methyltransferase